VYTFIGRGLDLPPHKGPTCLTHAAPGLLIQIGSLTLFFGLSFTKMKRVRTVVCIQKHNDRYGRNKIKPKCMIQ
jgi:hypothetical protein